MLRKPFRKTLNQLKRELKKFSTVSDEDILQLLDNLEPEILKMVKTNRFSLNSFYKIFSKVLEENFKASVSFTKFQKIFFKWILSDISKKEILLYIATSSRKNKSVDDELDAFISYFLQKISFTLFIDLCGNLKNKYNSLNTSKFKFLCKKIFFSIITAKKDELSSFYKNLQGAEKFLF